MGLEMVEIIMELEDEFRIDIKDEDLAEVRTVGALYDLVMAKLGEPIGDDVCMTSRVFFRLRKGLQETTGLDRSQTEPTTPLATLLPAEARRRSWDLWAIRSGMKLPGLQLPEPLRTVVRVGMIGAATALPLFTVHALHTAGVPLLDAAFLAVCGWGLLGWMGYMAVMAATSRWAVAFPCSLQTVGDLTHELVRRGIPPHPSVEKDRALMTPQTVWDRLVDVIEQEGAVKRELITPTAEFARDLGI